MEDLVVNVRDQEITVTRASSSQTVTYRREHGGPMLVVLDDMRGLDTERLAFLAGAWRAVFAEAKSLRWL